MASRQPAQRSTPPCTTCSRRKLKCDRQLPCENCRKSRFNCDYPTSRAAHRSRIDSSTELRARIEQLERIVKSLHKGIAGAGGVPQDIQLCSFNEHSLSKPPKQEVGKLIDDGGEGRYIENSFLLELYNEVSGFRDLIDELSDDNPHFYPVQNAMPWIGEHALLRNLNSTSHLLYFHPPPDQIPLLWEIFIDNIDPIVKMLHKPTIKEKIIKANISEISPPCEVLLFSIYFASVTSLADGECQNLLHERKDALLRKFRYAIQQALAKSAFLSSHNLTTLQGIVLYLICERIHDDSRFVWTLTATAIRIAQSLGLHHDGSGVRLRLPFFITEMRRRVWWQICTLDFRTAESHGFAQDMMTLRFDTELPLHVDDEAFNPNSPNPPLPETTRITEMTLPLMRYEIISVSSRLMSQLKLSTVSKHDQNFAQEIDEVTNACKTKLELQYLKYCDLTVPFHWFASIIARMMLAKMWINLHHYFKTYRGGKLTEQEKTRLFEVSVEILESSLLLEKEESMTQWKWAFQNCLPWQALALVLFQICEQTQQNDKMDHAWILVQNGFNEWIYGTDKKTGPLWVRMNKLMEKARKARALLSSRTAGANAIHDPDDYKHTHLNNDYNIINDQYHAGNRDGKEQSGHTWSFGGDNLLCNSEYDDFSNIDWDALMFLQNYSGEQMGDSH